MEQKDNGLTVKTTQYFRDSGGEITEKREVEKYKNSDAASIRTTIYRTNQYGAEEIELENGEPVSRTIRQQTSEPNTVEVIWYVQTGDANGKRGWVLESDQLVKTVKWQRGEKVESDSGGGKMIRVTDARGNRVEEIEDFPSEFHRETHVYDDRGREVERSEWKRDGDRINRRTYVYDDDQNGNWIKKTELFTSSAMDSTVIGETTTRRIEYY